MKQLVSINLTTRTARDWAPPVLTFGEDLTLSLRTFKNNNGAEVEAPIAINSLTAGLGPIDARPTGGKFAIKVGPGDITSTNTTEVIDFTAELTPDALAAALNAVEKTADYGEASVVEEDGSWLITFGDQTEEVELAVVKNSLSPISYGLVRAWSVNDSWTHEIRLVQAPGALTSTVESPLPPPPVVTRLQAGGTIAGEEWNEVQQLFVPPEFRGAYRIKRGYLRTVPLSRQNGLADILEALQALGEGCWAVTLPLSNKISIEFIGDYGGQAQDLLAIEVVQSPAGDPTFTLTLDKEELAARLRAAEAVTLPLEIRIVGTENDTPTRLALALPVTVRRPLVWPVLEGVQTLDLLRPYSPKTYVPFGANNRVTVGRAYEDTVGDGSATTFVIAHNLGTEAVLVSVQENLAPGRMLINGTDYEVAITDDNQVTVTALLDAPAADGWRVVVLSTLAVADWAEDLTVTPEQVVAGGGYPALPTFMDSISERVDTLEGMLGISGTAATVTTPAKILIGLPALAEAFPPMIERGPATARVQELPPLARTIRDASLTNISGEELPDPSTQVGAVYKWNATSEVYAPGYHNGRMITKADAPAVLSDGYEWWLAADANGAAVGTTFWPTEMTRVLWELAVTPEMLSPGRTLTVTFTVLLALLAKHPELRGVYTLRVRKGTMTSESGMAGNNVEAIAWDQSGGSEELMFSQRISLARAAIPHAFALTVARDAGGSLSATRSAYGKSLSATAPQNTQFLLRAELTAFDLENYAEPMGRPSGQVLLACGSTTSDAAKAILDRTGFAEGDKPTLTLAAAIA